MILIFLGPPGAGKGTQSHLIEKKYGLVQISTGDILRAHVKEQTEIGRQAEKIMAEGGFPSDTLIVKMLKARLSEPDCAKGFILDGFPRTIPQAEALDEMLKEAALKLSAVFKLEVPDEVIIKRLSGRYSCAKCGALYNDFFKPTAKEGVCDKCGSHEFIRRPDDNEASIKKRLALYHANIDPLAHYYEDKNILYHIDAEADTESVAQRIDEIMQESVIECA